MEENNTIESRVADTILQSLKEIKIGNVTYEVAPPSAATIILASKYISQLPQIKLNKDNILNDTLFVAKDCGVLGDILAVLILGAKNLTEKKTVVKTKLFGLIKEKEEVEIDKKTELAKRILFDLQPIDIGNAISGILQGMQLAFFFGIITSLIEINLLKPTKNVTTAFGQSLQGQ
jgi:hypothetical protein